MSALSVTIEELERAGLAYTVERIKHYKVKAIGLPLIVCSKSSSDHRSELQARSLVRRLIRQNGLEVKRENYG
jgi:hypothetical protein